ncbi:acyl-CoA dehydrogenase family protein [Streptomyces sp. NPDC091406]|uniref:acyl-CoA dehydrogenase family protein n=1 Tax=unclassified Streptomyces TaxID=2593676 RepID=UPI0038205401
MRPFESRTSGFAKTVDDWAAPGGPFCPALLTAHDEAESFPAEACAALDGWGLADHYVPTAYGGRLDGLDETHGLLRSVASRDMTVAVAHGKTFLGGATVWVSGDGDAAARVARHIMDGEAVSWGLTEPGHGSDLLAGDLSATRKGAGWVLSGRKWPVNNATRGRFVTVLARTAPEGGPRGFSVFLVDKSAVAPEAVRHLPKMPTHGIRGADISGVDFQDAHIPADALVGTVGQGLELVVKALQLTRIACAALSLGAGDHGLRLARKFLLERRLHGRGLAELPHARVTAGQAVARLLLAEAVSYAAARAAHEIPEELSVVSAVTKALVPTLVQGQLRLVAELLGARSFLTEVAEYGGFAKIERDHQIVSIFDGSTWVNRSALASVLPLLRPGRGSAPGPRRPITEWLSKDAGPTPLDPLRLRMMGRSESVLSELGPLVARIEADAPGGVGPLAAELHRACAELMAEVARLRPSAGPSDTATMRLAERYEWCFAGTVAIALWVANARYHDRPGWRDGLWLRGCLSLVLSGLGQRVPEGNSTFDELCGHLLTHGTDQVSLFDGSLEVTG